VTSQCEVRDAVAGNTVKTQLSHVYAKLGAANRTELATFAGPHLADD